jgi:hypothetical protein
MAETLPDWTGETAVVVGRGHSLTPYAIRCVILAHLEGRCRILTIKSALVWFLGTSAWQHWDFQSDIPTWALNAPTLTRTVALTTTYGQVDEGWTNAGSCFEGLILHNPTLQAIGLLAQSGATRAILIGCNFAGGRAADDPDDAEPCATDDHVGIFESARLADKLKDYPVEVLNATPRSRIEAFPRVQLEDCLGATD